MHKQMHACLCVHVRRFILSSELWYVQFLKNEQHAILGALYNIWESIYTET